MLNTFLVIEHYYVITTDMKISQIGATDVETIIMPLYSSRN